MILNLIIIHICIIVIWHIGIWPLISLTSYLFPCIILHHSRHMQLFIFYTLNAKNSYVSAKNSNFLFFIYYYYNKSFITAHFKLCLFFIQFVLTFYLMPYDDVQRPKIFVPVLKKKHIWKIQRSFTGFIVKIMYILLIVDRYRQKLIRTRYAAYLIQVGL